MSAALFGLHVKSFRALRVRRPWPMSKTRRRRVPASLYSELSEYASLLRALRTESTLDLSSQLINARPVASCSQRTLEDVELGDQHEAADNSRPFKARYASVDTSESGKNTSRSASSVPTDKTKSRDAWTRWPLLACDVLAPEWGLRDEIKLLATNVLRTSSTQSAPVDFTSKSADGSLDDGDDISEAAFDDDDFQSQQMLDSLTLDCSHFLSRVFASLAAHVPPSEKSMQNRLAPIDWESVLDIIGGTSFSDARFVNRWLLSAYFSSTASLYIAVR